MATNDTTDAGAFEAEMRAALFDTRRPGRTRRFTQDSPLLPDIWLAFAAAPSAPLDMLINPTRGKRTGMVAQEMRQLVEALRGRGRSDAPPVRGSWGTAEPRIVHMPGMIVARLYFNELMRIVLPSTNWWDAQMTLLDDGPFSRESRNAGRSGDEQHHLFNAEQIEMLKGVYDAAMGEDRPLETITSPKPPPYEFLKLIELTALVVARHLDEQQDADAEEVPAAARHPVRLFTSLYENWPADPTQPRSRAVIWNVTRNRQAAPAIRKSIKAMKADAGRMLFGIDCSRLRCAVIDSGIDTLHPAFANIDPKPGEPRSRVIGTYDFGDLRYALDPRFLEKLRDLVRTGTAPPAETAARREDRALARTHRRFIAHDAPGDPAVREEDRLADYLQLVIDRANAGLEIDWAVVEPLIHEPLTDTVAPPLPRHPHGTQVAGVLAAAMPGPAGEPPVEGVCPDLRLYDLRVVSEVENADRAVAAHDFEVIAALKFLGHLNGRADEPAIHAANVSISIPHDVSRFACGRTPICEECERLVSSGVVVVAAAGNSGYSDDADVDARFYRSGSITDPGNAELVLTVGATHREMPHQYGVSYFSSRGPTGDGRRKPDLVAPGEKLRVPAPGGRTDVVDGTSFAAPHVTGGALLMMARHTELIGRPQRIKEVLCSSATDLGREPYSQGAGMLDVLRALQSI